MLRWKKIDANGPQPNPRYGHKAVNIEEKMLFFGSNGGIFVFNEIHVYNANKNQWNVPDVKGDVPQEDALCGLNDLLPPSPRVGNSFTMIGNRIYEFGGLTNGLKIVNDLYVLEIQKDIPIWNELSTFGEKPLQRESHSAIVYQFEKSGELCLVIYGGKNSYGTLTEFTTTTNDNDYRIGENNINKSKSRWNAFFTKKKTNKSMPKQMILPPRYCKLGLIGGSPTPPPTIFQSGEKQQVKTEEDKNDQTEQKVKIKDEEMNTTSTKAFNDDVEMTPVDDKLTLTLIKTLFGINNDNADANSVDDKITVKPEAGDNIGATELTTKSENTAAFDENQIPSSIKKISSPLVNVPQQKQQQSFTGSSEQLDTLQASTSNTIKSEPSPSSIPQSDSNGNWHVVGIFNSSSHTVKSYIDYNEFNSSMLENLTSDNIPDLSKYKTINLEPGTAYRFRVCAVNSVGRSEWGETSTFKTVFSGYPGAPTSIKISRTSSGVIITWEPPVPEIGSSEVSEYSAYLAVKSKNNEVRTFVRIYCGPHNHCCVEDETLSNAHIDYSHKRKPSVIFRIAACNSKGYGPATQLRWISYELSKKPTKRDNFDEDVNTVFENLVGPNEPKRIKKSNENNND